MTNKNNKYEQTNNNNPVDIVGVVTAISSAQENQGFIKLVDCDRQEIGIIIYGAVYVQQLSQYEIGMILYVKGLQPFARQQQQKQQDMISQTIGRSQESSLSMAVQYFTLSPNRPNVETSIQQVNYSQQQQNNNVGSQEQKALSFISKELTNQVLARQACRRRDLVEIQTPGLYSNVVVRIIDIQEQQQQTNATSRGRKRRRLIRRRNCTIQDNTGSKLLCNFQWLCNKDESWENVMITNLVSRSANDGAAIDDDVVLEPTCASKIIVVPKAQLEEEAKYSASCSFKPFSGGTPKTKDAKESTQLSKHTMLRQSSSCQSHDHTSIVLSPIHSITLETNRVQLDIDQHFVCPHAFVNLVLHRPHADEQLQYQSASIGLLNGTLVVHANPNMMQHLCGSIPSEELGCKVGDRLQASVMEWLKVLLQKQVMLKWRLRENDDVLGIDVMEI